MVLLALGFLSVYGQVLQTMISDWYNDPNYSHGFLIPLISAYVAWGRRRDLAAAARRPADWGLALLGAGLCLFLIGQLAGENFTRLFSMFPVIAGAVLFTSGVDVLRILLFPFAYLVFMIPLPYLIYDAIAFPLKLFVSWFSVALLQQLGVPVLREGNIISFATTTLEVADACSGVRSIISLLALAAGLAHFTQKGWVRKATLVALAIPIAIAGNSFRVIVTGILASRYGARVAQGFFHEFAGLAIFAVAIALLLLSSFALGRLPER